MEIGYSILADYQRRGFASEAVRGLLDNAYAHRDITRVIAETAGASPLEQRFVT